MEVARAEAVRDDAAGLSRARAISGSSSRLTCRVDERLDADVVARSAPARAARRAIPRARARRRRRASTSFVLSFAACTSGWSNGLIPRIEPGDGDGELPAEELLAELVRARQRDLLRLAVGPVGRLAGRGHEALALLAGRLGDQLLHPEAEAGGVRETTLSRPARQPRRARARARARVALARTGTPPRISTARSSSRVASMPISTAGTIPNGDSAE